MTTKKKVAKEKTGKAAGKEKKSVIEITSIPLYNSKGKEIGSFELKKDMFTGEVNKGVLYQAVLMYNANKRSGNASTKSRGEVSGGGKKPFRQKGTGRARAGSSRSPLWRGGGKIFGPLPRDFSYVLPKKILRYALLSSLNSKLNDRKIIGIDAMEIAEPKTKILQEIMNALKLKGKSLFVLEKIDDNIKRASRNIESLSVKNYMEFNTMDVLNCDNVVMAKAALDKLPERFKDPA